MGTCFNKMLLTATFVGNSFAVKHDDWVTFKYYGDNINPGYTGSQQVWELKSNGKLNIGAFCFLRAVDEKNGKVYEGSNELRLFQKGVIIRGDPEVVAGTWELKAERKSCIVM